MKKILIALAVLSASVVSAQPRDGYYSPRHAHPYEFTQPPITQQMQPENRLIPKTVDVGSLKNLSDRARNSGGQCELLGNRMANNMRVFGPGAGITKQSVADAVMMGCL